MTVVSLMTDFGIKDGNVGVMKGMIWGDLSHSADFRFEPHDPRL